MCGLRLLLLGPPRIELDGRSVAGQLPLKHQALLYYLAIEGGPVSRSRLAALLWEDLDEGAARANLRGALTRLRRSLPEVLEADTHQVAYGSRVQLSVDRLELTRALDEQTAHAARTEAARAWRGPLMDGFDLAGAEDFERWMGQARSRAQRDAIQLRHALATRAREAGNHEEEIGHWRGVLDIDDADEPAHMALMRLLAANGQRTAAIAQYEACRAALAERLGARPSAECHGLYVRIHSDAPVVQAPADVPAGQAPGSGAGWPHVDGELVGREADLGLLVERLSDPQCQWLTVVGPGGVGKTRLALALAGVLAARFRHGALWLSGRDDAGALCDAETLAQQVTGRTGADRFEPGALLLLLDNLETVPDAVALLKVLQSRAPGVRVLATSRRRLGAGREWLLEIDGLSTARAAPDEPASSPAARLLTVAVRRLDPRFDPTTCAASVERLCERVGGLPLALVLAARSVHDTGIDSVLARLDAGLSLEGAPHGVEVERQRSIDLVMEDAWALLPEDARPTALRLAWLPGTFDLALAQAVGATVAGVETLRAHCWLRRTDDALLALHPLQQMFLRQRSMGGALRDEVRGALARCTLDALSPVAPLGDLPRDARPDGQAPQAGVASPGLGAAMLSEALEHGVAHLPAETFCDWVDRAVAMLWTADRLSEVAPLLDRATQRRDVAVWRLAGWEMRRGEALNTLGDVLASLAAFEQGLGQLGLARATAEGSRWTDLPAALWACVPSRVWPPAGPQRTGFVRLLCRAQAMYTQQLSFMSDLGRSVRSNLLASAVTCMASDRAQRQSVQVMSAYGSCVAGHPRLARRLLAGVRQRPAVRGDVVYELFSREGECATKIALGQWEGVGETLLELSDELERMGDHRHAMECHSLFAKLMFYQGQLDRAERVFSDNTERSLRRPGGAWRAWGPFGLAEVALCQREVRVADVRHWVELGSYWMTEMMNVDAAYALRRFGLMARLAWREGDVARACDAALGGAAAAERIPHCGFWVHEGLAGIGEVLVQLRQQDAGPGQQAVDEAGARLRGRLLRHGRSFPAGLAMVQRLQGEWALACGREPEGRQHLMQAIRSAERQGLRVELARSCQALAGLDGNASLHERARRLWQDMRASAGAMAT